MPYRPRTIAPPSGRRPGRLFVWAAALFFFVGAGCDGVAFDPARPFESADDALEHLPAADEALSFVALGDWGDYGSEIQRDVADRMSVVAERVGARFVVTTGDNFYDDGVDGVDDVLWRVTFENVYTHSALHVPWYPVLGNHDYGGDVRAQIDYTTRSDRWTMPARYYTVVHAVDDTTALRLVMLDTPALVAPDAAARDAAQHQLAWLDSTLDASTARWEVVVGHHPIYSAGEHGDDAYLQEKLAPVLVRHGVAAYLSGHDHNLQHLRGGGLDQFVSGAGAKVRLTRPHPLARFAVARPGFLVAAATPRQLRLQFVDHEGTVLYGTAIVPR